MMRENGVPNPLSSSPVISPSPFASNASNSKSTVRFVSEASSRKRSASKCFDASASSSSSTDHSACHESAATTRSRAHPCELVPLYFCVTRVVQCQVQMWSCSSFRRPSPKPPVASIALGNLSGQAYVRLYGASYRHGPSCCAPGSDCAPGRHAQPSEHSVLSVRGMGGRDLTGTITRFVTHGLWMCRCRITPENATTRENHIRVAETLVREDERGSCTGLLNWSSGHANRRAPVRPATSASCASRTAVQLSLGPARAGGEAMGRPTRAVECITRTVGHEISIVVGRGTLVTVCSYDFRKFHLNRS